MMLSMGERRISSKEVKPELSTGIVINFPEEIIEAILLRLPVRSLLILKCVCKSWYSLISSNYFIQTHLKISKEPTNFDRWRFVFKEFSESDMGGCETAIKHCSLLPVLSGKVSEVVSCGIPMESADFAKIVGVCNGLICVLVYHKFLCLCNPSTREIKKLPDLDDHIDRGLSIGMFGFGFDEVNEDYKVVCVMVDYYRRTYPVAKVYSLKSNAWKQTETPKEYVLAYDEGVFLNQRLHWSRRLGDNNRYEIASFDLANEVWEKTEIPDFYGQGFGFCALFGFGGCLSLLCKSPEQEVDLWVLKEYRNSQSWKKLLHIPQLHTPMLLIDRGEIQLADGPNGGTIVLLNNTCMYINTYDLKDNSFTQVVRMNTHSVFQEHIFIESLVPLTRRHQEGIKP